MWLKFAQEKWLKRKSRKYMKRMRIEKCTPSTLCAVYHSKSASKVCNMRWDVLAQMLSMANIHPGSRVLVFESLVGLLTGSVAYRMGGIGQILVAYAGQQPHLDMIDWLNLTEKETDIIQVLSTPIIHTDVRI